MKKLEHKGFFAKIMEADRLVGDHTFGLPPGTPLEAYHSDSFRVYPENWMKHSFVVPVRPNKGIWFDWRDNDPNNTAIIPTVKGCNPITGLQTSGFHLERYESKCPKHGCDFKAERFCPECGYNWPNRNYVSGSPSWLDGWMSEGAVRQFFFTEEMMRDIATHMIGKESTVPAFGFAFYSPKERRPSGSEVTRYNILHMVDPEPKFNFNYLVNPNTYYKSWPMGTKYYSGGSIHTNSMGEVRLRGSNALGSSAINSYPTLSCETNFNHQVLNEVHTDSISMPQERSFSQEQVVIEQTSFVPQKEVAIGAGAKIRQELPIDNYPLDSWKDVPDAVMTIYFVFQEEFDKMAAGGFNDFKDCKDGMLAGLPVG